MGAKQFTEKLERLKVIDVSEKILPQQTGALNPFGRQMARGLFDT